MGIYYEGRSAACWNCKFFIQYDETYRNGCCVRHAPAKIDENLADSSSSMVVPPGREYFQPIVDPAANWCSEFELAMIDPPETVPIQQPGIPV